MRRYLLAALLPAVLLLTAITWDVLATPPVAARAAVVRDVVTVFITLEPHPANYVVSVGATRLDGRPDAWGADTVYHHWSLEEPAETPEIDDAWPRMEPGRYRFEVTLQRGDAEFKTEPFLVEVTP